LPCSVSAVACLTVVSTNVCKTLRMSAYTGVEMRLTPARRARRRIEPCDTAALFAATTFLTRLPLSAPAADLPLAIVMWLDGVRERGWVAQRSEWSARVRGLNTKRGQ